MPPLTVQGRQLDAAALAEIQAVVDGSPSWSRRRIADELVLRWDWRNGVGRLKDMSCRLMLARLEEKGLVRLPARRKLASKRKSRLMPEVTGIDMTEITGPLSKVQPVAREIIRAVRTRRSYSMACSRSPTIWATRIRLGRMSAIWCAVVTAGCWPALSGPRPR